MLYPFHYKMAFAFSEFLLLPLHRLALRLAFHALHMGSDNVSTFHMIALYGQLRQASTPMNLKIPCKQLKDLHPVHVYKRREVYI